MAARLISIDTRRMHGKDGRVISNVRTLKGQPHTIFGQGDRTRSFCYVDDMVEPLRRVKYTDPEITALRILDDASEITIRQLAEAVIEQSGPNSKLEFRHRPDDDPKTAVPVSRIRFRFWTGSRKRYFWKG